MVDSIETKMTPWSKQKELFAFNTIGGQDVTADEELDTFAMKMFSLSFKDPECEESFNNEVFRGYYELHQFIVTENFLFFTLPMMYQDLKNRPSDPSSLLWAFGAVVPAWAITVRFRRWLHDMKDLRSARLYGKRVTIVLSVLGVLVDSVSRHGSESSSVFVGTTRWLHLSIFSLWMHAWTLSVRERAMLCLWIVVCRALEPPETGMSRFQTLSLLVTSLLVGFMTSLALERSKRISHERLRLLLAHAQSERLGDSQLNHVIKNKTAEALFVLDITNDDLVARSLEGGIKQEVKDLVRSRLNTVKDVLLQCGDCTRAAHL